MKYKKQTKPKSMSYYYNFHIPIIILEVKDHNPLSASLNIVLTILLKYNNNYPC